MDANQLQYHGIYLSQAIGAIQGVLAQFQGNAGQQPNLNQNPNQRRETEGPKHPFSFRKD
jgi:hypothetical protein